MLILYSRAGCHLCEEFILDLELLPGGPPAVRVVDIDSDPELVARYGERVPVLVRDQDVLCEVRLSASAKEKILEK